MSDPVSHMQRVANAIARIRAAVADLVSGGLVEQEKAKTAAAEAKFAESEREKEEMTVAVETLANDIAPVAETPSA